MKRLIFKYCVSLRAQNEKEKVLRFMTTPSVNECVCVFVRESERSGERGGGRREDGFKNKQKKLNSFSIDFYSDIIQKKFASSHINQICFPEGFISKPGNF